MNQIQNRRIGALDGLRGLAILMVILFHYFWDFFAFPIGSFGAYLGTPIRLAWSGVDLFFVLSGYLITRNLIDYSGTEGFSKAFLIRRAARILPLYLVLLTLFCVGVQLQRQGLLNWPTMFGSVPSLWPYWVMLQNNFLVLEDGGINALSPSWSLAIEEQFYLASFFLALLKVRRSRLLLLFGALIVAQPLIRLGLLSMGWQTQDLYLLTFTHLDGLAVGGFVAALLSNESKRRISFLVYLSKWVVAANVLLLIVELDSPFLRPWLYTVLALGFGGMLILIVCGASFWQRIFSFHWLQWLGVRAYSIYLLHIPVLGLCMIAWYKADAAFVGAKPQWLTMLSLVLTLVLSWACYRWIERPLWDWSKQKFPYADRSHLGLNSMGEQSNLQLGSSIQKPALRG